MKKIYSHSKISTFEQCPYKFKLRYIDRIIPEKGASIESHLGKVVHSALEWLYKQIKKGNTPKLDELIIAYKKFWESEYKDDIVIVNKSKTKEDYFNQGIVFLINYYTENYPFDDNTLECEKKISIKLFSENLNELYEIIGFIDRLVYNPEKDEYEIHDYKTANSLPSYEKIENDRQLALYSLAIKNLFGHDKNVRLIWHYLAYNKKIKIKKSNDDLKKLKKEIIKAIEKIENAKDFPPNLSKLCEWCEYNDICPFFNKDFNKEGSNLRAK